MKNYKEYLISDRLLFYCYDWDDNILHMPTYINLEKKISDDIYEKVSVLPSEFSLVRNDENYRILDNNPAVAFSEFTDIGKRGDRAFILDMCEALNNKNYGPSWDIFLSTMKDASVLSIITARAHEYPILKEAVAYVIDNCMTDEDKQIMYKNCLKFSFAFNSNNTYPELPSGKFTENVLIQDYLDTCKYYGVGTPISKSFAEDFNITDNKLKVEIGKKIVLERFISLCIEHGRISDKKVAIGFSDDDKKNVEHVKEYFKNMSAKTDIDYYVYDTSNKEIKGGIKSKYKNGMIVESSMDNTDASLLRFNSFNSMNNNKQNATSDFSGDTLQQKAKVAVSMYKNIKNKSRKIRKLINKKLK